MNRMLMTTSLAAVVGVAGLVGTSRAAKQDTARVMLHRPSTALLMRLARAQQLSAQPVTFQTQSSVAVAARRAGDAAEQQKRTLEILNNQYLRGTAATTPSEADIRTTVGVLEAQLNAPDPPPNAYEIRYYLSACYESLGDHAKAVDLLHEIVNKYASSKDEVVQSFVVQARADLKRLGG